MLTDFPDPTAPAPAFVALDFETTGLDPTRDRIVEVGAIRFAATGEVLGTFASRINPGFPCPPRAAAVHGISDAELAAAPGEEIVIPRLAAFLVDSGPAPLTLVAHNAPFDVKFLAATLVRLGMTYRAEGRLVGPPFPCGMPLPPAGSSAFWGADFLWVGPRQSHHDPGAPPPLERGDGAPVALPCPELFLDVADTLVLARRHWPCLQSYRLAALADRFGLPGGEAHRALADADRCRLLYLMIRHGGKFRPLELAVTPMADGLEHG